MVLVVRDAESWYYATEVIPIDITNAVKSSAARISMNIFIVAARVQEEDVKNLQIVGLKVGDDVYLSESKAKKYTVTSSRHLATKYKSSELAQFAVKEMSISNARLIAVP
jgi:hypothetical protein